MNVVVSSASGADFPAQVREATRFLTRHAKDLSSLRRRKLNGVLDFGVYHSRVRSQVMMSYRLPTRLIEALHRFGLEAEISWYDRARK